MKPGPMVTAILNQNPDALYVSLFGSDWLAFVREAQKRGLFQKTFVVGILLGEPEYIDPLGVEAPEGTLVTGYPWYDVQTPAHKDFVAKFRSYANDIKEDPELGAALATVKTRLGMRHAVLEEKSRKALEPVRHTITVTQ